MRSHTIALTLLPYYPGLITFFVKSPTWRRLVYFCLCYIDNIMWRWPWPTGCTLVCVVVCYAWLPTKLLTMLLNTAWGHDWFYFFHYLLRKHNPCMHIQWRRRRLLLHFSSLNQRHGVMDVDPERAAGSYRCFRCCVLCGCIITLKLMIAWCWGYNHLHLMWKHHLIQWRCAVYLRAFIIFEWMSWMICMALALAAWTNRE